MDTNTKAAVLAKLYNGEKPKIIADSMENVTYAQALKLSKQLKTAKTDEQLRALFDLPQAAIDILLEAVKTIDVPEILEGELEEAVKEVAKNVEGMQLLEAELSKAATTIVKNINLRAASSLNADTLLILAEALSKIQIAFFAKSPNVQIANFNGQGGNFEEFLTD